MLALLEPLTRTCVDPAGVVAEMVKLRVSGAPEVLVTLMVCAAGRPPATEPNEMVDGTNTAGGTTAFCACSRPDPTSAMGAAPLAAVFRIPESLAVLTRADFTWSGVRLLWACFTSAAAPLRIGADKLVPAATA